MNGSTSRSRAAFLVAAGALLTATAPTQSELAAQLERAVSTDAWSDELWKLGAHERPTDELVDALVVLRGRVQAQHFWSRAMSPLEGRWQQLEALWQHEPDKRRARAAVFAEVMGEWAWRYRDAGAAERADIVHVAQFLTPFRHHEDLRAIPEEHARWIAAAAALQRIAVAAVKSGPVTERLRRMDGDGYDLLPVLQGHDATCTPFHLAAALADGDSRVRARAALALRRLLWLTPPPWLAEVLGNDPAIAVRQFVSPWCRHASACTEAEIRALIAAIERDDLQRPMARLGDPAAVPLAVRADLARALVAAGLRTRAAPAAPGTDAEGRARWCFARAASLGPREFCLVLALAVNATADAVVRDVVAGLAGLGSVPAGELAGAAAPLGALLDHRDDEVARGATVVADCLLEARAEPALRARLAELALAALAKDAPALQLHPAPFGGCASGPVQLGPPATKAAQWVRTAAVAGERRLLAPLIAELARCLAAAPAAPGDGSLHEWFVLDCLAALAPFADAAQVRKLHELLRPRIPAAAGLQRDPQLALQVLFRTYPSAPDELLPWYLERLREPGHAAMFAHWLEPIADLVPAPRAQAALESADSRWLQGSSLWLGAPELLAARWLAGGTARDEAVSVLAGAAEARFRRIAELAAAGRLPRALAAAAAPFRGAPLPALAQVVPEGSDDADCWAARLAQAIDQAETGTRTADLAALQQLAGAAAPAVVIAAARRALALGNDGRDLARAALARLAADADNAVAGEALRHAVAAGIELPDLRALVDRLWLAPEWLPRVAADAAALRFLGAAPRECRSGSPGEAIAVAKLDADAQMLRAAFGDQAHNNLPALLHRGSTASRIGGLRLAGGLPWWTKAIESMVMLLATEDDPGVRLAAYEALHSRDAAVWACALLVHEAALDPDPAVQEFAQRLAR